MLIKYIAQQFMNFFTNSKHKVFLKYQEKYDETSQILDNNPQILNVFHNELKKKYSPKGRETTFSSEQFLRLLIIKRVEDIGYVKTEIRVTDSIELKKFARLGANGCPCYSNIEEVDKAISSETWAIINEQLFNYSKNNNLISSEKLRVDSTASETNIHYPTDISLLWDCYRVLVNLIRTIKKIYPILNIDNRFHDTKMKKKFVFVSTHSKHKNKSTKKRVKKTIREVINKIAMLCSLTEQSINTGEKIGIEDDDVFSDMKHFLKVCQQVVEQSTRIHIKNETVKASEKIFSVFEEHTELLKRGKVGKMIEFGHMVTIGQTDEKFISFYDVKENSLHDTLYVAIILENHKRQFGEYPEKFAADKNYWESPETTADYEKIIDVFSVGKKGNKNKEEQKREKSEEFKEMQKFRAGIEGSISVLKRVFGLKRCLNKGFKSFSSFIGQTVFCHNLIVLATQ